MIFKAIQLFSVIATGLVLLDWSLDILAEHKNEKYPTAYVIVQALVATTITCLFGYVVYITL